MDILKLKNRLIKELLGFNINSFVEKPDLETAKKFVFSKKYFWNSGIFLFKASVIINEMKIFCPEIYKFALEAYNFSTRDLDFLRLDKERFNNCPDISLDKAVMEKTKLGIVVPMNVGWSDVGNWSSLWQESEKDSDGNILVGKVINEKVFNSCYYEQSSIIVGLGIEGLIIIETNDAVLVANKEKSQDIKGIVSLLNKKKFTEGNIHKKVLAMGKLL